MSDKGEDVELATVDVVPHDKIETEGTDNKGFHANNEPEASPTTIQEQDNVDSQSSPQVKDRCPDRDQFVCFFTAQCTLVHMRGLGIACRPSVRPSVCPSVTLVDWIVIT